MIHSQAARIQIRTMPEWANRLALTRFTVSEPKLQAWFSGFDNSVSPAERIRPGSFGLLGHPLGFMTRSTASRPARSYERDPERWELGPWFDRQTGAEVRVTTLSPIENAERFAADMAGGAIQLQTLADVLARYRLHPESKSLGPDGRWAHEETRGLMQRRKVSSAPVLTDLCGKEGNKLIERLSGEIESVEEYRTDYGARADRWRTLVVPVLRQMRDAVGTAEMSDRIRAHRRSLERVLGAQDVRPHASTRKLYLDALHDWCLSQLAQRDWSVGRDRIGTAWCYQQHVANELLRTCRVCGRPVAHRLARYCSEA